MKSTLRFMTVLGMALVLTACGGGGGGGSDSGSNNSNPYDADTKYTGKREQASLTTNNQYYFVQALYGKEYEAFSLASANNTSVMNQEQGFSKLTKTLTALAINSVKGQMSTYQPMASKPFNQTYACSKSGNYQVNGELDDQTLLGVVIMTYNNCVESDAPGKLNGTAQLAITGADKINQELTAFTLTFQNFNVTYDALNYVVVGTQNYSKTSGIETTISNIHRLNKNTNKQSYLKNYKVVTSAANATTFKLSGQVYLQDYGYANLSTLSNITFNSLGVPTSGQALLAGANNSKLRLTASASSLMTEVDSNGDNVYESKGYITLVDLIGDNGDVCISGC